MSPGHTDLFLFLLAMPLHENRNSLTVVLKEKVNLYIFIFYLTQEKRIDNVNKPLNFCIESETSN